MTGSMMPAPSASPESQIGEITTGSTYRRPGIGSAVGVLVSTALARIHSLARWPSPALVDRTTPTPWSDGPAPLGRCTVPAAFDVRPRGSSRSLLVRSADGLDTFVGLLSLQGVLLDSNAMSPARPDLVTGNAFGNDFWEAPLWSWSPVVQERLRAAIERAAAGDPVRYDETMRVGRNNLVTIDITLTPLVSHDGLATIVCSIIDSSAALGADRHWVDPQPADRQRARQSG